jgi:hypothetical protein
VVKWEYKVVAYPNKDAEKIFNALGDEGWELAGSVTNISGRTEMVRSGTGGNDQHHAHLGFQTAETVGRRCRQPALLRGPRRKYNASNLPR